MRLIPCAMLTLMTMALGATCQAQQLPRDEVLELNARYQATQLQLQQQRIDNELARLQLEYAQLISETQQVTATAAPDKKAAVAAAPAIISDVTYRHLRVQIIEGPKPQWRVTRLVSESSS